MAQMPRTLRGYGGAALVAWAAAFPASVHATAAPPGHREVGDRPPALADTVALLVVSERPWSPAVAVTLSFAGGHGDDPPGGEGTAWLLGLVLERAANANLEETGAGVEIEVGAVRTWVTLLATRTDWPAAYRTLTRTLLDDAIDPSLAEAARTDLVGQLLFQRNAPVRSFELETERMLHGAEHPFARAAMGSPASVSGVTVASLQAARARVYAPDGARVAVGGAVAPEEAAMVVGAHRTMASRAGGAWTVEGAPLRPRDPGPAWATGGRFPFVDEITNSWIVAAYPFPRAVARTGFEFVAHVVRRQLVSDPPAPGLISRRVELRDLPDGPVLLVTAAVESHTAPDWERRVAEAVERLATSPLAPDLADRQRRSFRSARALELAYPEREGRWLLAEIEAVGRLGDPGPELDLLSPDEFQRVAAALGEPRVLVYGPLGAPP